MFSAPDEPWTIVAAASMLAILASGCSDTVIENRPPYACTVIPHHVFDLQADSDENATPVETKVNEGSFTSEFYDCMAENERFRYFYQQWQGSKAAEGRRAVMSRPVYEHENVPADMGEGWIDSPRGTAWVNWRCDDRPVLSRVSAPGDRERDEKKDLLRLLEIAQERYAQINDCTIRPPE